MHWKNWKLQDYQASLGVLLLLFSTSVIVCFVAIIIPMSNMLRIGAIAGAGVFGCLSWAEWKHQTWSRPLALIMITLLTCAVLVFDTRTRTGFSPGIFVPTVLALILGYYYSPCLDILIHAV